MADPPSLPPPLPPARLKTPPSAAVLVLGIVSIIFGTGSLIIGWIPFVGLLVLPCSGLGLLLAIIGLVLVRSRKRGRARIPAIGASLCILAIVVVGTANVITHYFMKKSADEQVAQEEQLGLDPPARSIKTTATQFRADYDADEAAADQKYLNRTLEITGTVDSVGEDMLGKAYLTVGRRKGLSVISIQCFFAPTHVGELAGVRSGQTVTVRGRYRGFTGNYAMRNCELVPEANKGPG